MTTTYDLEVHGVCVAGGFALHARRTEAVDWDGKPRWNVDHRATPHEMARCRFQVTDCQYGHP